MKPVDDIAAALRRLRAALQLVASQPDAYGFPVQIGDLHAVLGELDEAVRLLRSMRATGEIADDDWWTRCDALLARHPEGP